MTTAESETFLSKWSDLFLNFASATPEMIEDRALQRRSDTKYLLSLPAIQKILPTLDNVYSILHVDGRPMASYKSLYFDTPDFHFYHSHRQERRTRYKIRIRHYLDRALSFLEVKKRLSDSINLKVRIGKTYGDNKLNTADLEFINTHCPDVGILIPTVWTNYKRTTLISRYTNERLTIDFDLNLEGHTNIFFPQIGIVEVKQSPRDRRSAIMLKMRENHHRPQALSKYCTAMALLQDQLPRNKFLPTIKSLRKLAI